MLDLRKFCHSQRESQKRSYLNVPHAVGEFVYATNGHLAVQVPRAGYAGGYSTDLPESPVPTVFAGIEALAFGPLPALEWPAPQKCTLCAGSGLAQECSDCKGLTTHVCPVCDSELTCRTCRGRGQTPPEADGGTQCDTCRGTGADLGRHDHGVPFLNTRVNPYYVYPFRNLPGIEVAGHADPTHWVSFRFEGGHAVIMPIMF